MLNHWREEYKAGIRFTLWCAFIIYTPIVVWAIGKAVYEDHEYFVNTAKKLHTSISYDANTWSETRRGLDTQISDWKAKCSGLEGANGVLSNQNRDQQNTINNCQAEALKLLEPKQLAVHIYDLRSLLVSSQEQAEVVKSPILLMVNKPVTPVTIVAKCDTPIDDLQAFATAPNMASTLQLNISRDGPNTVVANISSPAITPEAPFVLVLIHKKRDLLHCDFNVQ
jgi:hypothetical protein